MSKLPNSETGAAPPKLTDAEFKFYDEIYHPQTGGWTQTPLFHRAFADYLAGTFDPQRYIELLDTDAHHG